MDNNINIQQLLQQNQEIIQALINNRTNDTTSAHPSIRLKDPPCYDGVRDAVVIDDWITAIENQQEFHEWNTETTFKFAVNYLTGRAAQWMKRLKDQGEAYNLNWDTFKAIFLLKYRPDNADLLARDLLASCVQKTSIEAFVEDFQDVIHMLPNLTEDEKCDRFMRGIASDEVRAILRNISMDNRSLDLYISTALSYEAARAPNYHALAKHLAVQTHIHSSTVRPSSTSSSQSAFEINDPMEINVVNQFRQQNNKWKQQRGGSGTQYGGNNNGGNGKITCFYCGCIGHIKRNCNKLRREIEKGIMERTRGGGNGKGSFSNRSSSGGRRGQQLNVLDSSSQNQQDGEPSVGDVDYDNKVMNNSSAYYCGRDNNDETIIVANNGNLICNTMDVSGCVGDLKRFKTADFNSLGIDTELPLYRGTVEHVDTKQPMVISALVDTGASECYISPRFARATLGSYKIGLDCEVQTACGSIERIDEGFIFTLNLQGHRSIVSSFVYDSKFDIILGRSWLKAICPDINFKDDTMRIVDANSNCTFIIQPTRSVGTHDSERSSPPQVLNYLISHQQASRWMKKKGTEAGLLFLKENGECLSGTVNSSSLNVLISSMDSESSKWYRELISDFPNVFQDKLNGIPPERGFQHIIDTQDSKPVDRHAFKMSPVELDELHRHIKELLELGLIQPSSSPWGAPVLFCKKKDGSLRMCIDYRALNQLTVRNTSPLPRIDECLDRLKGASYFTSLDLKSGYHQIRIQPEDVPKTAFNTRYGKFEFLVLPFGLCNSPPSFQQWMNDLLGDFIDSFALVYLDDVLIYSKTWEDHKKHVRLVLERFEKEKLVVNKSKCNFSQRSLTFLGYEISSSGILPSREKVKAIRDWPKPENVQQVRQFLGLSQHYRRFIRGFSSLAAPLTALTQGTGSKTRAIEWDTACQESFDSIKQKLMSAPLLRLPDMALPFRIETDSSDYGVGCVLLQCTSRDSKDWHPIAFESKKLSKEEQKFPAQERELIGIVHALRTWRCYIDGCAGGYVVYSDHNRLVYFRKQTKPTPRLVRWISELEMYSPVIMYKAGKTNVVADALSRIGGAPSTDFKLQRDLPTTTMEPKYLYAVWSKLAPGLKSDWPLLYTGDREKDVTDSDLKKLLRSQRDNFVVKSNMVFRKVKHKDREGEAVIKEVKFIPFTDRADLVTKYHEGFGHASLKNMQNMFHVRYWWPNMRSDLELWLSRCPACQLCSRKPGAHQDVMHPLAVPHAFERWHIDFVGQLPTTPSGNKWLITAVDYTTNRPIARAMPVASKEAVADFIYEEIVMKFGCPIEMVSDRGANLTSGLVEEYLKRIGVKHKLTSAFHARSNGKVERYNGIIKTILRKYVLGDITLWDQYINPALWATRIRVHSTTGFSPFYLTYGRDPHLPGDPLIPFVSEDCLRDETAIAYHTARELTALGQHRAAAEARLKVRSEEDKIKWDLAMKGVDYEVGDLVMLTHEDKFGLEPNYKGPFIVTEVFEEYGTCRLETMAGQKLDTLIHKDRLKHAKGDVPDQAWYDPTSSRRKTRELTSSRSGMRTTYAAPTTTTTQIQADNTPSAFTRTAISGTSLEDNPPVIPEEDLDMESMHTPSSMVSRSPVLHQQQVNPTSIIDGYDEISSGDNLSDTEVIDVDSDRSEEFVEASSTMVTVEEESKFILERDLLQRQKQAFEEDRIKVQQQQQLLWDKQKLKEEELKRKEDDLKKKKEEQEVELKKKSEKQEAEWRKKKEELAVELDEYKKKEDQERRSNVEEVKKSEEIDNSRASSSSTVVQGRQEVTHDSEMIEAPSTKILRQIPQLDATPGTVPEWPFTFTASAKGGTTSTSLTRNPFTAEQEEVEDLVQQSTRYHQGSKRKVFKPSISSRKRGKSRPTDQQ